MNFVKLIPVMFSALLLAAHFLRANMIPLVIASLLFPLMLLIRKAWAARAVQVILVVGTVEWIRTAITIGRIRRMYGAPWTRMAIIIGSVAAVTALSALILQSESLKKRYGHGRLREGAAPDSSEGE